MDDHDLVPQWEAVYRGYVIRHANPPSMFIGPTIDLYRVARRQDAARFTKKEALDYMVRGVFCTTGDCARGPFVIEDAI